MAFHAEAAFVARYALPEGQEGQGIGAVQYGFDAGGGAIGAGMGAGVPEVPVLDTEDVGEALAPGTWIVCPARSEASEESPLSAASVCGEIPFAAAIDERLSPAVTVCEDPEVEPAEVEAELAPALARAAPPSASVGISIVSPRVTGESSERPL
jgi:hypothetical protein